jgi:hypothetical protein
MIFFPAPFLRIRYGTVFWTCLVFGLVQCDNGKPKSVGWLFFIPLSYILVLSFGRYRYLPSVKYVHTGIWPWFGTRNPNTYSTTEPSWKEVKIYSVSTPTKVFVWVVSPKNGLFIIWDYPFKHQPFFQELDWVWFQFKLSPPPPPGFHGVKSRRQKTKNEPLAFLCLPWALALFMKGYY